MKSQTPYVAVNEMLERLLSEAQRILGDQFVGMYLDGSLALGDFNEATSDIDVLVLTADFLSDDMITRLANMHRQLGKSGTKWGYEMEVSYVPQVALNQLPRRQQSFVLPRIERGETLTLQPHDMDWVIHCYILREHGITLLGPPIQMLLDPISPDQIRQATYDLFKFWWRPMIENPQTLQHYGYCIYATLTMCRILYTIRYGKIVSKPAAAQWAMAHLPEQWRALVQMAIDWREEEVDNLAETVAFIQYTSEEIEI